MTDIQSLNIETLESLWEIKSEQYKRRCVNCGATYETQRTNAPKEGFCALCDSDYNRDELMRVQKQRRRAVRENKPATLTFKQWIETVEHFNHKCAYCQKADYADMEHFMPLRLCDSTRGTTMNNVVPACKACNYYKKSKNPMNPRSRKYIRIAAENLDRVYQYLKNL